ncbi:hypothetical protein GH721_01390 [Kriegella sp. EG-1]|nr:hypothetical protein [Flavobacteriaceae bacterium EG-1]
MNKFILNIIGFMVLLFVFSKCFDGIITYGLQQSETKLFDNLRKINKGEIRSDLIINGSSKALVQIDPIILDSILDINCYNLGLDGTPFIPQKAQYEFYRQKNIKPKIIIQVVSNGTLRSLKSGFKDHIKFAPYLDIPQVNAHMKLIGSFGYLDYHLPLYRYRGKPFETITGILSFFKIKIFKTKHIKGYSPNDRNWIENKNEKKESKKATINSEVIEKFTSLDSLSIDNFESYLDRCKKENIITFLVYPPIYSESFRTIKNIDYYKKAANNYNAIFLDYSKDSTIANKKLYFYNSQHLNKRGATVFTKKMAKDIVSHVQFKL